MTPMRFSDAEYAGKRSQTRRERFLAEIEQVVPRAGLPPPKRAMAVAPADPPKHESQS